MVKPDNLRSAAVIIARWFDRVTAVEQCGLLGAYTPAERGRALGSIYAMAKNHGITREEIDAALKAFGSHDAAAPAHWAAVLELDARTCTAEDIHHAYRRLAGKVHPDIGGSTHFMQQLTAARDAALREKTKAA